jgi:hypothetical protein
MKITTVKKEYINYGKLRSVGNGRMSKKRLTDGLND